MATSPDAHRLSTPKAGNAAPPAHASPSAVTAYSNNGASIKKKHEDFKNQLVHDVFGRDNKGRVPMEKVAMLIWQFRNDPAVVNFMAQFVAKFSGTRQVFDGIEFYLPQIAHMIIHLEANWDEAILERFALVIAQQSQHFALQLTWILMGAIQDYQPETVEGRPNPSYNQLFYQRCITLLSNIERCVVYGSPRSIELQRRYEKGDISRAEYDQMKLEDRLHNARQITTHGTNFGKMIQRMTPTKPKGGGAAKDNAAATIAADAKSSTTVVQTSTDKHTGKKINKYGGYLLYKRRVRMACYKRKGWKSRYFEIEERMLYCYNHRPSIGGKLIRAMPLEGAVVREKNGKYLCMFEVQNHHFEFVMRAKNNNEMQLWMKLLRGESEANALIPHIISDDEVGDGGEEKKEERNSPTHAAGKGGGENQLTPSQQARYDFFKNERDFVAGVCDVAEVLRFHEPKERKARAPGFVAAVPLPACAYVPLCKSTDVFRRVDSVIAKDTRVFNTNERCPMIYYFVTKRGEQMDGTPKKNPNLDVAEYLHGKSLHVPDMHPVGSLTVIGEEVHVGDSKEEEEETKEEEKGDHMEDGDDDTLGLKDPTESRDGTVWSEDSPSSKKSSFLRGHSSTTIRKGNDQLRKFMEENVVKLPSKLSLQINRFESRRKMSYLDRNAQADKATPLMSTPIIGNFNIENAIIEHPNEDGNDSDVDSLSLDGQSIVSGCEGSIIQGDQVVAFQQADGVNRASLDRAKEVVCGGELWTEKSARMLRTAREERANKNKEEEDTSIYEIVTVMAKSNDDLRQEVFIMQMIHYFESVFAKSNIPVWLKTYRILSTSKDTGLIEVLTDATSIDGLKKADKYPETGGMRAYFVQVYGPPTSHSFLAAQQNFTRSLAGYSLVSYLLGLKDRHNGNIMIDTRGHIIHIDFGFAFGMAPGHEWSMERAPFKLTKDYVDVMGGPTSECFKQFQKLFVDGLKAARGNSLTALGMVEIMMYKSNYPCFTGTRYGGGVSLKRFEKRLMLDVPDAKVEKKALQLINNSMDSTGTKLYDIFQNYSNGLAI